MTSNVLADKLEDWALSERFVVWLSRSQAVIAGSWALHAFVEQKAAEPAWYPGDMDLWLPQSPHQQWHIASLLVLLFDAGYSLKKCFSGARSQYKRLRNMVSQTWVYKRDAGWPVRASIVSGTGTGDSKLPDEAKHTELRLVNQHRDAVPCIQLIALREPLAPNQIVADFDLQLNQMWVASLCEGKDADATLTLSVARDEIAACAHERTLRIHPCPSLMESTCLQEWLRTMRRCRKYMRRGFRFQFMHHYHVFSHIVRQFCQPMQIEETLCMWNANARKSAETVVFAISCRKHRDCAPSAFEGTKIIVHCFVGSTLLQRQEHLFQKDDAELVHALRNQPQFEWELTFTEDTLWLKEQWILNNHFAIHFHTYYYRDTEDYLAQDPQNHIAFLFCASANYRVVFHANRSCFAEAITWVNEGLCCVKLKPNCILWVREPNLQEMIEGTESRYRVLLPSETSDPCVRPIVLLDSVTNFRVH